MVRIALTSFFSILTTLVFFNTPETSFAASTCGGTITCHQIVEQCHTFTNPPVSCPCFSDPDTCSSPLAICNGTPPITESCGSFNQSQCTDSGFHQTFCDTGCTQVGALIGASCNWQADACTVSSQCGSCGACCAGSPNYCRTDGFTCGGAPIPGCGGEPPTATPTTGPSCTYGSCSSAGAVQGSGDPNGYYSCDGTCWQWVNCPAGQTFNGSGCSGGATPTATPAGGAPTSTPTPSGGSCGSGNIICGGSCWPDCCTCDAGWATCDSCGGGGSCVPNGGTCFLSATDGCCSGYCPGDGLACTDIPTCSGCQTWNGLGCVDNDSLCSGGEICVGGACQPNTHTISGTVFIDTDEDGNRDGGESGYQGATVVISPGGSNTSNSTGFYSRSGLIDGGDFTVNFTVPSGYTATNSTSRTFNNLSNNQTANFGIISEPVDCPTGLNASPSTVNPGETSNLSITGCTGVENPPDVSPPPPFDWDPPQDDNPADEGDPQCSDGIDNDGDSLIDTNDPRCHWDGDSSNPGSYIPNDDNESPADSSSDQCSDGIDNDGEGFIDSLDPECHTDGDPDNPATYNPNDDNESDRISPNDSGSTTCSDASLVINSSTSTQSFAGWTAQVCPAFQQVCTVTVIANGPGGTDTNSTNVTVRPAGTINVDVRDVSDGSPCNSSAPLLTDEATLGLTGGVTTTETITDGSYSFTCLPNGNYDVSLGLPPGYQMASGTTVQSTTITDANKTRDLTFCVVNFNPWFQTTSGDVRMRGIVNPIPSGLVGSTDSSNPSVFFSTQFNASVETGGSLSQKNWLINREYAYNSLTRNRNGVVTYSFYKNRARQEGIPITSLTTGALDNNNAEILESGVYEWEGDMTINGYSHIAERAVILVNGDVTIESDIDVPAGSLLIVAASGNITIGANVGQDSSNFASTAPNIEGIYSAQGSIILEGDECGSGTPDRRLNVEGALIANAQKPFASDGGGIVQNNRSLCLDDDNYPSLYVATRADFLTKLTDFYKVSYTKWREVNP